LLGHVVTGPPRTPILDMIRDKGHATRANSIRLLGVLIAVQVGLLVVRVSFWFRYSNSRLPQRGSYVGMCVFNIPGIHVSFRKYLQELCRELDTLIAIWDARLNQWPHLKKKGASCSPTHA
jgi:hypothetical protein